MKTFFRNFFIDIKKVRWNKTKPTLKVFAVTVLIVMFSALFVFFASWGLASILTLMKG